MNFELKTVGVRDVILSEIIKLGNKNSKTLGMFPEGAFLDHAKKRTIIAAVEGGNLVGYVLYRYSPKKTICLYSTSLCSRKI